MGVRSGAYNAEKSATYFHRPRILFLFLVLLAWTQLVTAAHTTHDDDTSDEESGGSVSGGPTTLQTVITTTSAVTYTLTTVASHVPVLSSANASASSASVDSTASATISTTASTSPVTIPQPFDTAKLTDTGANFTSTTCPPFMRDFVSDPNFTNCVPFSLLLYTSVGFTAITREVRP
jgi:hypothetical protein